jgi:hypothetical protein
MMEYVCVEVSSVQDVAYADHPSVLKIRGFALFL